MKSRRLPSAQTRSKPAQHARVCTWQSWYIAIAVRAKAMMTQPGSRLTHEPLAARRCSRPPVQQEGYVRRSERGVQQILPRHEILQVQLPEGGHLFGCSPNVLISSPAHAWSYTH